MNRLQPKFHRTVYDAGVVDKCSITEYTHLDEKQQLQERRTSSLPHPLSSGVDGQKTKDRKTLIENKCKEYGWRVIEFAIQPDHVHLLVETFPTTPASEVVKQCKGVCLMS